MFANTLCGVCPHRLFSNTKSDMGQCSYAICGAENPKMSDPLKEWNELPQNEKDKYGYEYNTMLYLQKLVRGCDNKIVQSKKRLEAEDRPATMAELNEDDKQKLVEIAQQMQDKLWRRKSLETRRPISEALHVSRNRCLNKRRSRKVVVQSLQALSKMREINSMRGNWALLLVHGW